MSYEKGLMHKYGILELRGPLMIWNTELLQQNVWSQKWVFDLAERYI